MRAKRSLFQELRIFLSGCSDRHRLTMSWRSFGHAGVNPSQPCYSHADALPGSVTRVRFARRWRPKAEVDEELHELLRVLTESKRDARHGKSVASAVAVCSICGKPLNANGDCLACLLRTGLEESSENLTGLLAFGDFEVARREDGSFWELGRGAMGVTYLAVDKVLHRRVALKVIEVPSAARGSQAVRDRFLREARAAAALRHPNVAAVLQFGLRRMPAMLLRYGNCRRRNVSGSRAEGWPFDAGQARKSESKFRARIGRGGARFD